MLDPEAELDDQDLSGTASPEQQSCERTIEGPLAMSILRRLKRRWLRVALLVLPFLVTVSLVAGAAAVMRASRPVTVELDVTAGSVFHRLPDIFANLNASGPRLRRVRVGVTLEVEDNKLARLIQVEPAILSLTHDHLRELKPEDLSGRAGIERLRGFIQSVISDQASPWTVRNVHFTTLLVD
ncbi:MAG: flagellar basal body-associated FliL family protein [Rhodospirillales bacterium]|nr:flagellar basal body-associated FliL family protein [Rhodospirillales bacterium]